jgi:hypothetical protein
MAPAALPQPSPAPQPTARTPTPQAANGPHLDLAAARRELLCNWPAIGQAGTLENAAFVAHAMQHGEASAHEHAAQLMQRVERERANDAQAVASRQQPAEAIQLGTAIEPGVIYPEYDSYPGYPPDWEARKAAVRKRDNNLCQVTGCPSICARDVHHKQPISEGGLHRLENLVCLCQIHHWLLPHHQQVAERVATDRFTIRRAHSRRLPGQRTRTAVRATFARHQPASLSDLEAIRDHFGFRCRTCYPGDIQFAQVDEKLVCACLECRRAWLLDPLLPEELGPLFTRFLRDTQNPGKFQFDLDLLPGRPEKRVELCYACASKGRIAIFRPKDGAYGQFGSCSNFPACRNTDERQHRRHGLFRPERN